MDRTPADHICQSYGQGTKWAISVFIRRFTALQPEYKGGVWGSMTITFLFG